MASITTVSEFQVSLSPDGLRFYDADQRSSVRNFIVSIPSA
jgi:hypothetical protein